MKKLITLVAAATLASPVMANDFGQTGSVSQVNAVDAITHAPPVVHTINPNLSLFVAQPGFVVLHPVHAVLLAHILVGQSAPLQNLILQQSGSGFDFDFGPQ